LHVITKQSLNKNLNYFTMKKLFSLTIALCFATLLHAQITNNEDIDVGKSDVLHGAIQPLTAKEKFYYDMPWKLNYISINPNFPGSIPGGSFNSIPHGSFAIFKGFAAKYNKKKADYVFTLITPGIKDITPLEIVKMEAVRYRVETSYKFPCKLEVRDKDSNLLKTFILSEEDEVHRCFIYPNFLNAAPIGDGKIFQNFNFVGDEKGFISSEAAQRWLKDNEKAIYPRMEMNALKGMADWGNQFIPLAYGFPDVGQPEIYGLTKKDAKRLPELNQAVLTLQANVERAYKEPITPELSQELIKSADFFASQYDDNSTKEMRELCTVNAGMAYLLAGETDKAHPHLLAAWKISSRNKEVKKFATISLMNYFRANKDKAEIRVIPSVPVNQYVVK